MGNTPSNSFDTPKEERFTDLKTWFKVSLEYPENIKEIMKKKNLSLKSVDELAFLRWIAFMIHQEDLDYWFKVLADDLENPEPVKDTIKETKKDIYDVLYSPEEKAILQEIISNPWQPRQFTFKKKNGEEVVVKSKTIKFEGWRISVSSDLLDNKTEEEIRNLIMKWIEEGEIIS